MSPNSVTTAERLLARDCSEIDMGGITLRLLFVDGIESAQRRKSLM